MVRVQSRVSVVSWFLLPLEGLAKPHFMYDILLPITLVETLTTNYMYIYVCTSTAASLINTPGTRTPGQSEVPLAALVVG
ncbi:hypothetical protein P167DRAFT_21933 [Morchella conica CCBAS932]|uniref:Uncharacterized protein n=1 Tax=Morchella conica CCBAS932 TaxID=1392247 RepID=A0A3N4L0R8_9PEZI|nr:hypothetical protein P167DRAFT_21933 [Morchella conica CCBAS932]